MALLRGARHVWNERAVYAPNTVLYHPDLDGADGCSSTGGAIGRGHSPASLARYLDVYGHEITSYYRECTADLEDLAYDIVFGEDEQREGSGEACRTGHDSLFSTANLARLSAGLTYCGVFVMVRRGHELCLLVDLTLFMFAEAGGNGLRAVRLQTACRRVCPRLFAGTSRLACAAVDQDNVETGKRQQQGWRGSGAATPWWLGSELWRGCCPVQQGRNQWRGPWQQWR